MDSHKITLHKSRIINILSGSDISKLLLIGHRNYAEGSKLIVVEPFRTCDAQKCCRFNSFCSTDCYTGKVIYRYGSSEDTDNSKRWKTPNAMQPDQSRLRLNITFCSQTIVNELTDFTAMAMGFKNKKQLLADLKKVFPLTVFRDHTPVTVVTFERAENDNLTLSYEASQGQPA